MQPASYYREQAARARRLAETTHDHDIAGLLTLVARDYEDIVEDLERKAIVIRHPERMPQRNRSQ